MSVTINGTNGLTFADSSTQNTAATGFGFKNRIINGAMMIDQRNAGASVNNTATNLYTLDRWVALGGIAGKFSIQQNAGSVTPPAGFKNYLGVTSLSAFTPGSTDSYTISQNIEGFNTSDLGFGAAGASTITLSFWVRSSLTGTFGGTLDNAPVLGSPTRSYPFSYTINAANTWQYVTLTVAGDTTGTWTGATNGTGLALNFSLGVGSTWQGTANAWYAGNKLSVTGETQVVGTSGATFYITGVQLEKGSTATSFDYRPYGTELALCQRYYQTVGAAIQAQGTGSNVGLFVNYVTKMRAAPTITLNVSSSNNVSTYNTNTATDTCFWFYITPSGAGGYVQSIAACSAEL